MKIYFKNGMTLEIAENIGEMLNNQIIKGCNKFQTFSDQNGKVILIVNLEEVVYVQ